MHIIEDYINNGNRAIVISDYYTDELLQAYPEYIFVFGDNEQRYGKAGQASIRDEQNAFGIATKRKPSNKPDAFMKDCSRDRLVVMNDLDKLQAIYQAGVTIVLPKNGLGTGLSDMPRHCPEIFADMNTFIKHRFLTGEPDEGEEP